MNNNLKQLSIIQIILLHLLPGLPMLLVTIILTNPSWGIGLPVILSLYLATTFCIIPGELLIMLFYAKRSGKKFKDIITYTEKTSIIKTILWVLPLFTILGLIFSIMPEVEKPLWTMFNWVPDWFRTNVEIVKQTPYLIWPTIIIAVIINGFLGPIVEEFYFRGFLLPRMSRLGKIAPLVNVVLFSAYHFFAPWENITRILGYAPCVYAVWYKRNICIGMVVHCLGNMTGIILTAIYWLS